MLRQNTRNELKDQYVAGHVQGDDFSYTLFLRLGGKKRKFERVNFSYCIFDTCYLRNCTFTDCNFTGAVFLNSQFNGTAFDNCDFKYARFDKTEFDEDILRCCPSWDNTKKQFAQSLRTNFRSLGESELERKAASIEISAELSHLYKSWGSNEGYYRSKYKSLTRIKMFFKWLSFKLLNFIWGNGESLSRLLLTTLIFLSALMLLDIIYSEQSAFNFFHSIGNAIALLFNTTESPFPPWLTAIVMFIRFSIFGLFIAILIKKWGHR